MVGRWVIRGLAVALLAGCVAAWVGSYWGRVTVYHYRHTSTVKFETQCGAFTFREVFAIPLEGRPEGCVMESGSPSRASRDSLYESCTYRFAGFAYQPKAHTLDIRSAIVPMWFVTLVAAGVFGFGWRKTRSRFGGRGFPVEHVGGKEVNG
jgi:hypothetical protein